MAVTILLCIMFTFFIIAVFAFAEAASEGKVSAPFKKYKMRNQLYKCKSCKRLFRHYQWRLVRTAKEYGECPHCNKDINIERFNSGNWTEIEKPDKWMNVHTDCPRIGLLSYLKILKAIRSANKLLKEEAVIKRFEEYNNLKVDVDWITKLQKDLSK